MGGPGWRVEDLGSLVSARSRQAPQPSLIFSRLGLSLSCAHSKSGQKRAMARETWGKGHISVCPCFWKFPELGKAFWKDKKQFTRALRSQWKDMCRG